MRTRLIHLFALAVLAAIAAKAQTPVRILDTLMDGQGRRINATLTISWGAFVSSGTAIPAGSTFASVTNGNLDISLIPNLSSGIPYIVRFPSPVCQETWLVPVSGVSLGVVTVRQPGSTACVNAATGGGSGAVASVFGLTGAVMATATANHGLFGPTSGSAAAPTLRLMTLADLPACPTTTAGQVLFRWNGTAIICGGVAGEDVTSGTVAEARIADLSAAKITSGTLALSLIPAVLTGKEAATALALAADPVDCGGTDYVKGINAAGVPVCSTPAGGSVGAQSNGTLVGTRPILNWLPGTGFTWTLADDAGGTRVNIQGDINTAVIPTKAAAQSGAMVYCASTISGTAHSCSLNPSLTAYTTGQVIQWIPSGTMVAGAQTLNIDAQGAVSIKKIDGTDPASGDIVAGRAYTLTKLASAWQVTAGIPGAGVSSQWYPASSCSSAMFNGSALTPSCINNIGTLQFRSVTTNNLFFTHRLKSTVSSVSVQIELTQNDGAPSGVWPIEVSAACVAAGATTAVAYGTAATSSVTVPASEARATATFPVTPSGTCSAGNLMQVKLFHNLTGDTGSGQWAKLIGAEVVE